MPEKRSASELADELIEAYREILKADVDGMAEEPRADYLKLLQRKMSASNALLPYVFTPDGEEADAIPASKSDSELEQLATDMRIPLDKPE
jgi:hypothetical protein